MEIVGVVGLGKMGKPMARRLIEAGHAVIVHSRSQGPVEEIAALGATKAPTPRDLAANADIIICSLPDSPTLETVCLGTNGIHAGARLNTILVDTSTTHPEVTRRVATTLAERGMEMLDAPVSGGEPGAIAGTLSIMVGGSDAAFKKALPVLEKIGRTITHMGPSGSGQYAKLANQIIVALNYVAIAEGLVLGAKAGLDPAKLIQALQGGLAQSKCLEQKGERIITGNYEPGGRLTLHIKDLQYALDTARAIGVPLPATAMALQYFEATRVAGRGAWDHSAVVTLFEDLAGVKIRKNTG
ncbi:MAG: NAD-binding protein [Acidobacteria bacterium]|nr:NAD-binding protein [Acidobacteriota bacterium]